jgi:hypothetical protein
MTRELEVLLTATPIMNYIIAAANCRPELPRLSFVSGKGGSMVTAVSQYIKKVTVNIISACEVSARLLYARFNEEVRMISVYREYHGFMGARSQLQDMQSTQRY